MQFRAILTGLLVCALASAALDAQPVAVPPGQILGDYDAELRKPDGHVDVKANIEALKQLGVNTYFYLIWHNPHDWDDLPAFATAAEKEGIKIWVYVIPWSETRKRWGASKPFGTDFVKWGEEIARLSLEHKNVVGWSIDDFYVNATQPDRFTRKYTTQMLEAAKAINPALKFYPLVYFQQDWGDFMDRFAGIIDGVVAAYPQSSLEIEQVLKYLRGDVHGFAVLVNVPKGSKGGVRAFASRELSIRDADKCKLTFYWDAGDLMGKQQNTRMGFVRVNGETVWKADANGGIRDDDVVLDLSRLAKGHRSLRIELGAGDEGAIAQYPVAVKFDDVRLTGFEDGGEASPNKAWRANETGGFTVNVSDAPIVTNRKPVPLILMPAGDAYEHKLRYGEEATGPNVSRMVRLCLRALRQSKVEGVVLYCLPKDAGNAIFDAVADEFHHFQDPAPAQKPRR